MNGVDQRDILHANVLSSQESVVDPKHGKQLMVKSQIN